VPKLSDESLEKRFRCDYCGETFRTRQGLSGHIQFKHLDLYSVKKKTEEVGKEFVSSKIILLSAWNAAFQLPKERFEVIDRWIKGWLYIHSICEALNIKLTKQDFKNYLLKGLEKELSGTGKKQMPKEG